MLLFYAPKLKNASGILFLRPAQYYFDLFDIGVLELFQALKLHFLALKTLIF